MGNRTLKSLNDSLVDKGLSNEITVTKLDGEVVFVKDLLFGEYKVNLKSFSPCMKVPMHRERRHLKALQKLKDKFIGKEIKGLKITDIFYGPDEGYKNKSFYFKYLGNCGHSGLSPYIILSKHRKTLQCNKCSKKTKHGERKRINGKLTKRTPTYIYWVSYKKNLGNAYQEFKAFRSIVGEKPSHRANLVLVDGIPRWSDNSFASDKDTNLIATAVRQAFRYSSKYKECLNSARVDTPEGVRFKCNCCGKLSIKEDVHIDHVSPINPVDGSLLARAEIIKTIWDSPIQVLDKLCHAKKSTEENAIRRKAKSNLEDLKK